MGAKLNPRESELGDLADSNDKPLGRSITESLTEALSASTSGDIHSGKMEIIEVTGAWKHHKVPVIGEVVEIPLDDLEHSSKWTLTMHTVL